MPIGNRSIINKFSVKAGVSVLALAAFGALSAPTLAVAQDAAEVEAIVVTGSRIVRDGFNAPTPTTVIGIEEIQKSAPVNIADYVNTLPQLAGSSSPRTGNAGTSGGTNGINSLNLRGLGTNRTLVLLDGQRVVPSTTTGVVDINNLPTALVQRVDVVTGGASAAYGSDAVAGVVNFILDKNFTGLKGQYSTGISERNDAGSLNAELAYGRSILDDRAHILLTGEYGYSQGVDILDGDKRKWYQSCNMLVFPASVTPQRGVYCGVNQRNVAQGGVIRSTALADIQFGAGGQPLPFQVGSPVDSNFMVGGNVWGEGNSIALESAIKRYSTWGRFAYDITDNLTFALEASYGYSRTQGSAAYQRYPGTGSTALAMRADNPFLDPGVRAQAASLGITQFNYGYATFDLGRPQNWAERETTRVVASLAGKIGDTWNWDAYYQTGKTTTAVELRNTTDTLKFREAIDAVRAPNGSIVCRSTLTAPNNGCVPLNIFGIGVADEAAIRYVKGLATQDLEFTQDVAALTFNGQLLEGWAGPIMAAVGVEYRKESVDGTGDDISLRNGFFTGNFKGTVGEFDVKEGFAEIIVPLASDMPFFQSLEFNGAARYTSYSLAGEVQTWKAGLTWTPIDDIRFRGTLSRDIRAPNLNELFNAGSTARQDVVDLFQASRPNVSITRVTAGNPDLEPEVADTTSFGVVFSPTFLPQFTASIDYYSIDINDAVASLTNQQTMDRCFNGETSLCSLIIRNAGGTVVQINGFPVNVAQQITKGIDYEASFRQSLGDYGNITLRALVSNIREGYTLNNNVQDNYVGENTGSTPDWRWNYRISYDYDRLQLSATAQGFSGGVYDNNWTSGRQIDVNEIDGATYYQLSGSYRLLEDGQRNLVAFFNIDNLFDTDPEIVAGSALSNLQTNSNLYDVIGRSYRAGLRFRY